VLNGLVALCEQRVEQMHAQLLPDCFPCRFQYAIVAVPERSNRCAEQDSRNQSHPVFCLFKPPRSFTDVISIATSFGFD
jgi:hypothetical protein